MTIAKRSGNRESVRYETSLAHVRDELELASLRVQAAVKAFRRNNRVDEMDQFKGLYISENEVDELLDNCGSSLPGDCLKGGTAAAEEVEIERLRETIAARKAEALRRGIPLRLDSLQRSFFLSQTELDIILICLLPEVDLRYQRLYAYLQDDMTRKSPSISLVLRLLCGSSSQAFQAREYFYPESPLVKYSLLELQEDRSGWSSLLIGKSLRLDERITGYLLDRNSIDSRLVTFVSISEIDKKLDDLVLRPEIRDRMRELVLYQRNNPLVFYLSGECGASKPDIARAVSAELSLPLLAINARALLSGEIPPDTLVHLAFREAYLQGAVVFFDDYDVLRTENKEGGHALDALKAELSSYPRWALLGGDREWPLTEIVTNKPCINVKLPSTTYSERLRIWEGALRKGEFAPDVDVADLANKFRLSSEQISRIVATAANLARWRDPGTGLITGDDLNAACRKESRETLDALARKVNPSYGWEDIVLPKDQKEQLREICRYVEHYHIVYDEWGFGRKISLGKGLNVLFSGPSGTGKTMAAEVLANALKVDLYKIDLSTIVSKYIGETEKNLEKIFREGQTSNAILFFDEADALFGKRSEVRDSHDRYANIEIAYLLQKMDEYEGVVILATNLRKNMDEAFARRMHYALEFPIPEEPDRYRIWRNVFPGETPLGEDADLKFMARQFKITGGNIKNIAVNAAFLAAADGGCVTMESLIKATKREYQKIGKLCTEGDFASYFGSIKS